MRHLLSITDLTPAEIAGLLDLARKMKKRSQQGKDRPILAGQNLALVFQKPSLRTRVSFEVGMEQLGGHSVYLSPAEVGLGVRESAGDVARVLSRYTQGIMARVFKHADLETMAHYASVPVINGLSDYDHPCQVLADLLTLREHIGDFRGKRIVFIGDGYNMANGLLFGASKSGLNITIATPDAYRPSAEVMGKAIEFSEETGAMVRWTTDPREAVRDADVVYTDVWTSMGQEADHAVRREAFKEFQLNAALMQSAPQHVQVMHCLPAHRGEEITDEVADAPNSLVFDQAENRLHAQKAVLAWLLGGVSILKGKKNKPARKH